MAEEKEKDSNNPKLKTPWKLATANRRSQRQETRLGNLPGGKKQINSGRTKAAKRDVRLNGYLIEARTTEKESYSLKRKEFEAIEKDALSTPPGVLPALQVDFEKAGAPTMNLLVVRLGDHVFMEERIATLEEELREARSGRENETE